MSESQFIFQAPANDVFVCRDAFAVDWTADAKDPRRNKQTFIFIALVNLKDAIVAIPSYHLECGLCLFPRFPLNHEDGSF